MKGTITKIDKKKWGNGADFQRLYFDMERQRPRWAKTDLVEDHNNWRNWKDLLKVGNILEDLELRDGDPKTIDADCKPRLIGYRPPPAKQGELF